MGGCCHAPRHKSGVRNVVSNFIELVYLVKSTICTLLPPSSTLLPLQREVRKGAQRIGPGPQAAEDGTAICMKAH